MSLQKMLKTAEWEDWPFLKVWRKRSPDKPLETGLLYDTPPPFILFLGTLSEACQMSVDEIEKRSKSYVSLAAVRKDGWRCENENALQTHSDEMS